MWILTLKNNINNIGFKTNYHSYASANIDFLKNLQHCRNLNDKIEFINDNEFKSYRKNKLCITCKINDSDK